MLLILLLHLILDASVSIIRAYSDILRGHPCLIDLVNRVTFIGDRKLACILSGLQSYKLILESHVIKYVF